MGQNFWARGYCVSTVGLDEETIREYVRSQEEADKKLDQLKMFELNATFRWLTVFNPL